MNIKIVELSFPSQRKGSHFIKDKPLQQQSSTLPLEQCSILWVTLVMSGASEGCSIQKNCQLKVDAAEEGWNLHVGM